MNKDLAAPTDPLTPTIRINLDLADGRSYEKLVTYDPETWQASSTEADVRIGENRFSGDLHTYRIHATIEAITVDITLIGQVPAWRPQTATCSTRPCGLRIPVLLGRAPPSAATSPLAPSPSCRRALCATPFARSDDQPGRRYERRHRRRVQW